MSKKYKVTLQNPIEKLIFVTSAKNSNAFFISLILIFI